MEKSAPCSSQQLLIKPGWYIGNGKLSRTDLIMRKPYVFMHKCDLVQCLLRQHGSSFVASREFCGDLVACLFLVVFWLAVKIFSSFTATFAEIRLGGYRLLLGGL